VCEHLSDPTFESSIAHASCHTNLDGRTQYRGRHLPGSVHFDIDHLADKSNPLPHMLPNPADFAKKCLLGISNMTGSSSMIAYVVDRQPLGLVDVPRLWS